METYLIANDVRVVGRKVKSFPEGIAEAFEKLANTLPDGLGRAYYGISYFNKEGVIVYQAAGEEKYPDEAEKYNLERYCIEKGEYLMESLKEWRSQTTCIKDIFHQMMKDKRVDPSADCVEWYKDDNEMWCLIRIAPSENAHK